MTNGWVRSFAQLLLRSGVLFIAFAGTAGAQDKPISINIGWQPGTYYAFYVARDSKLFERAGLQPNYIKFTAGPPMFAAFQSGSIDVSWGGAVPAIIGAAQGVPIKVIALESITKNVLIVHKDAPIRSIAEVKGKKIGSIKGSGAYFAMTKLLDDAKLNGKYEFLDMQFSSLIPSFVNRDVDGIWVWEPWASRAEAENGRRVADEIDIFGAYPGAAIMARSGWLTDNPEAARRFLVAMRMAQEEYAKNPERVIKTMTVELGIPEAMAASIFQHDPKPTFTRQLAIGDPYCIVGADSKQVKMFQTVADFFAEKGFIKTRPVMSHVFDTKPLVDAMK